MSVGKAIEFTHLSSQLTSAERQQFLNQLPIDIVNTALFQYFIKSSNNQYADTTNNLLINIIRSRKKKPSTITTQNIKLDKLPKPLIGVISSFLPQYDYINFSKLNRFIFLGCNTPNLLQELNLTQVKNYSCINLQLFPSVKTFAFNLDKFNELKMPSMEGLTVMNDLQCITLNGEWKGDIDITSFMTQNCINTSNITTVKFFNFGNHVNPFNSIKFNTLLNKFPNITYFVSTLACTDIDTNKLQVICPNLRGIATISTKWRMTQSLIDTFGTNLRSLIFNLPSIRIEFIINQNMTVQ